MKKPLPCGIEVSAKSFELCLKLASGKLERRQFANTASGIRQLAAWLKRQERPVQAVLEATGVYGQDLTFTLCKTTGVEVMVANPRAARRFAEALMKRAKTDRIDAEMLCQFAQRMPFEEFQPPGDQELALRSITRRILALTQQRTEEKNRLHAASASRTIPAAVSQSLNRQIVVLNREIDRLDKQALKLINNQTKLKIRYQFLLSIPGIGPKSASRILAELAVLPKELTPRQWVAHAGLDPKPVESGSSVNKPRRISKTGNSRLRQALYMPALSAARANPHCRSFYLSLQQRGLKPMQAIVAIMRKLLHAIHGIWTHATDFDATKLFPNVVINH